MKTFVRFIVLTALVFTGGLLTGCDKVLGPKGMAYTVFENNTPHIIDYYPPARPGTVVRMDPGTTDDDYLEMSVIHTWRWTYPDGTAGKTITARIDAERRDATGPSGEKADAWIKATGQVQFAALLPINFRQWLERSQVVNQERKIILN